MMFLILLIIMLFPLSITCFDITKILSQYPAYSSYSNYLTQTQLASEINSRQTITVLAVDNSGMAPISGKPMDVIKKVLSIHVILDYFDVQKFQNMGNQTITASTLFQSSGQAKGSEGFMKVTDLSTGAVTFTSPSDPNGTGANLVKAVVAQPYNISVVQISTVILPPSLLASSNATSHAPSPAPVVSPIPAPVPVVSPVPVAAPVIVPVPVISPVSVVSPVPIATPVPVPVKSPVPVAAPAPVAIPATAPAPIAVPAAAPAPVAVPVEAPAPAPGPGISPVEAPAPVLSPTNPDEAADGPNSGVIKSDVNNALALFLTFSSIYVLLSRSMYNIYS
jgi:hypothetical protein